MHTIRIRQKLNSETLYLPQLRPWLGKQIEIVVQQTPHDSSAAEQSPTSVSLVGSVRRYDDPLEPATAGSDWESSR